VTLAVYILLDVSASMSGARIEALKEAFGAIRAVIGRLSAEWGAARFSVMQYGSQPVVLQRHVPMEGLALPPLSVGGSSALGKAWKLLAEWLHEDAEEILLAFLLTDGPGNDDWIEAGELLYTLRDRCAMIGVGCGYGCDLEPLSRYLDQIVNLAQVGAGRALETALSRWLGNLPPRTQVTRT
jgi:uncharacterized protein YegL